MLSYRHSYHAGDFVDVLKHIVLVEILQYFKLKNSALAYIDTHAGAGLFDLHSEHARKLGEYCDGMARLRDGQLPKQKPEYRKNSRPNPSDRKVSRRRRVRGLPAQENTAAEAAVVAHEAGRLNLAGPIR